MAHLLYSSNEMYSSTELIRKSKTIFNKILSNEIDKAIIMRDGKPSFMLLDFDKYEQIMAEYDILKLQSTTNIKKKSKVTKEKEIVKIEVKKEEKIVDKQKIISAKVIPPTPAYVEDPQIEAVEDLVVVEKIDIQEVAEKEVQEGLEVLEDLDFDEEFKKEVERKVRERKDREVAIKKEQEVYAIKEEIKNKEKEQRQVKKTELKEFWA